MEFDDCAQAVPTVTLVFTLPHLTLCIPLSCETFRGEPATRQFDWSFAPTPRSHDRFERQNRFVPPPAFPQASHCPGIAHCLSGLTTQTIATACLSCKLLGPCSKTGATALPSVHSISHTYHYSRKLPSQYLFAIGLWLYLALDAYNHPFILHYQTALLCNNGPVVRDYHPVMLIFPDQYTQSLTTSLRFYHVGMSAFARRY